MSYNKYVGRQTNSDFNSITVGNIRGSGIKVSSVIVVVLKLLKRKCEESAWDILS